MGDGVTGRLDVYRMAVDIDRAAVERVGPEYGPGQLCTSGSHQSGDPQYLTAMKLKADVVENYSVRVTYGAGTADALSPQYHITV